MIFSREGDQGRTYRQYQRLNEVSDEEWAFVDDAVKARMTEMGFVRGSTVVFPTDGLVGYWPLSDPVDYVGSSDFDAGNGTFSAGHNGNAWDSSGEIIEAREDYSALKQTGDFSFGGWVYRAGATGALAGIFASAQQSGNSGYMLVTGNGNEKAVFYLHDGGWKTVTSNLDIPLTTWTHIWCELDGTTMKMYVDNVLQTQTTTVGSINYGTPTTFARFGRYAGQPIFNGLIDEFAMFNKVLTSDERTLTQTLFLDSEGTFTSTSTPTDEWFETETPTNETNYYYSSNTSYLKFTTSATKLRVTLYDAVTSIYQKATEIGVRVDGVDDVPLYSEDEGPQVRIVRMSAGNKTVELVNGLQLGPNPAGIHVVKIESDAPISYATESVSNRVVVYGDSIAAGGNTTEGPLESWPSIVRTSYGDSLLVEAYGTRALSNDANAGAPLTAFVAKIASYSPNILWIAIGVNDWFEETQSASAFETMYAAFLVALNASMPSLTIYAQTPIVNVDESANSFGDTLGAYRTAITNATSGKAYVTDVDGTAILTTGDLEDNTHPTTAGHATYAAYVKTVLGIT